MDKITFTDAQKARINELVVDRLKREQAKFATHLEAEREKIRAEVLAELTAKANTADADAVASADTTTDTADAVDSADTDAADAAKKAAEPLTPDPEKVEESQVKRLQRENLSLKKEQLMRQGMEGNDFYAPAQILTLTKDRITFSKELGRFVILDEQEQVMQNPQTLQPLSLKEFYKNFANENPHLCQGTTRSGTGAGVSNGPTAPAIRNKQDLRTTTERVNFIKRYGEQAYRELALK